jgi:murein DD-endopeptidase MepM/ murein hydrolase activator NlpD
MAPEGKTLRNAILSCLAAIFVAATTPCRAGEDCPKADVSVINMVNNEAAFNKMVEQVEPLVKQLGLAKTPEERSKFEYELVNEYGEKAIECLIRYREPFLIPVFSKLIEHKQWYVRRLAIWATERNGGYSEIDRIVARLDDDTYLVRETAAICIAAFYTRVEQFGKELPKTPENAKALKDARANKTKHVNTLKARLEKEENKFVKAAIEGSILAMSKVPLTRIHEEPTIGDAPCRRIQRGETGQLSKWTSYKYDKSGGGKCAPTKSWGYPVSVYPDEIFGGLSSDKPLVALAAKNNSLHFGHDCAWFLEGCGVYAIADGVVRTVKQGCDWGGLIVVEHVCEDGTSVNALYGHCGMWLFASPGMPVKKGQLLGVMGLSFSPENGGHGAHSHFGMFSGKFDAMKCYGRGGAGMSTTGWLVPADFLGPKVENKAITPASYR